MKLQLQIYRQQILCSILLVFTVLSSCKNDKDEEPQAIGDQLVYYFSSNRSGNYEIWMNDKGVEHQITNNLAFDSWWPRISPDKNVLLFYRSPAKNKNNNYQEAELWSMKMDDSSSKRLISLSDHNWKAQGVADWSPDGNMLVMAAIEGSSDRWHIFTTDGDGQNAVKVSKRTSLYLDPSFSPDGAKVAYTAFPPDYNGIDISRLEIYTMNIDGSDEKRLTNDTYRDHDPYWAPDGSEIAFESALDPAYLGVGKWALRAVKPDGTNIRNIIHDGNINTLPIWSKDSRVLYFHRFVFGGSGFRLFKINKDGSNLEQLTHATEKYDDTDIVIVD